MLRFGKRLHTVFQMTAQGHSCGDIAETMRISINTVKGYRRRIYKHLNIKGTSELRSKFG